MELLETFSLFFNGFPKILLKVITDIRPNYMYLDARGFALNWVVGYLIFYLSNCLFGAISTLPTLSLDDFIRVE